MTFPRATLRPLLFISTLYLLILSFQILSLLHHGPNPLWLSHVSLLALHQVLEGPHNSLLLLHEFLELFRSQKVDLVSFYFLSYFYFLWFIFYFFYFENSGVRVRSDWSCCHISHISHIWWCDHNIDHRT